MMKLRRFYRFLMLAATGGVVLQATTDCTGQLIETVATTVVSVAADVILQAMLGGMTT
jgi:hypothetical protein